MVMPNPDLPYMLTADEAVARILSSDKIAKIEELKVLSYI